MVVGAVLIGGAVFLTNGENVSRTEVKEVNNVSIVDGTQIVEIDAKGGYLPRKSIAKAGVPTVLRFNTNVTFDCSSSVRIPSLDISKILPQTGSTDIDIGVNKVGTLDGTCSMGMYPFEVEFVE